MGWSVLYQPRYCGNRPVARPGSVVAPIQRFRRDAVWLRSSQKRMSYVCPCRSWESPMDRPGYLPPRSVAGPGESRPDRPAVNIGFLLNQNASPLISSVPLLLTVLMTPPPITPYCAEKVEVMTLNS